MNGLPLPDDGGDGIAPPLPAQVPTDRFPPGRWGLTLQACGGRRGFTGQSRSCLTARIPTSRRGIAALAGFGG
ncbi:hypothetical protein ACSNOJ_13325 [Streptomyces sp. URMC 128]|uniref:hypothetical protein n=1 Tax=Streptomyces sp. URMC 128 TaxID=3423404 RepID=UPI003F1C3055